MLSYHHYGLYDNPFRYPEDAESILEKEVILANVGGIRDEALARIKNVFEKRTAERIIIFGERGAGKTSLCKYIMKEFHEKNHIAIRVRGVDLDRASFHELYLEIIKKLKTEIDKLNVHLRTTTSILTNVSIRAISKLTYKDLRKNLVNLLMELINEHDKRVFIAIDQLENVIEEASDKEERMIYDFLYELIISLPIGSFLVISSLETVWEKMAEYHRDLYSGGLKVTLLNLNERGVISTIDDLREFIKAYIERKRLAEDQLAKLGLLEKVKQNPLYPFTRESLEIILDELEIKNKPPRIAREIFEKILETARQNEIRELTASELKKIYKPLDILIEECIQWFYREARLT